MPGLFRHPPQPQQPLRRAATFPVATSVDAGLASGTGEAFNATTDIKTNAGLASGVGHLVGDLHGFLDAQSTLGVSLALRNRSPGVNASYVATVEGSGGNVVLSIYYVDGSSTLLATTTAFSAESINQRWNVRFDVWGDAAAISARAHVWHNGDTEPTTWLQVNHTGGASARSEAFEGSLLGGTGTLHTESVEYIQPSASINIQPNSGNAAGTGAANSPATAIATSAGGAAGTGQAGGPAPSIAVGTGTASGTGTAYDATALASKQVDAGLASGTGTAHQPSVAIGTHAGVAIGTTRFPSDSSVVTDSFNRADETPIGAPWDVTPFSPQEANLVSNQWENPVDGGGAFWGTTYTQNFETSVELATAIESDEWMYLSVRAENLTDWIIWLGFEFGSVVFYHVSIESEDLTYISSFSHTPAVGDRFGFRRIGQSVEGWFKTAAGDWQLLGAVNHTDLSGEMVVGLEGGSPDRATYLDNFRVDTTLVNQNSVNIAPNTGLASGTGQAYDATVATTGNTNAAAGLAAGTGEAFNATTTILSNPGAASGTGQAFGAAASIATSSGGAAGSGTAGGPSPALATGAGTASGTGTAYDATISTATQTNADAGLASGTGDAFGASIAIAATAGAAGGGPFDPRYFDPAYFDTFALGQAFQPATSIATNAGGAAGAGAAGGPAPALAVGPSPASGTGQAYDATVVAATPALAGVASGTGEAFGASIAIAAGIQNAAGTGTAYNATIQAISPFDGSPKKGGRRRQVRVQAPRLVPVELIVSAVVPAPTVAAEMDVNDDEVVLELLASLL